MENKNPRIQSVLGLARKVNLPAAILDLSAFDSNVMSLAQVAEPSQKKIRVATKSVRSVELLKRVFKLSPIYQGLMCFTAKEALFLAQNGFDDFLLAYPTSQAQDLVAIAEIEKMGKKICVVCDSEEGLRHLNQVAKENNVMLSFILEVDLSLRLLGQVIGVRRSPLKTADEVLGVLSWAKSEASHLQFKGLMGYEAQVAGLGDQNKFKTLMNPIFKIIRKISIGVACERREKLAQKLSAAGYKIEIFNGGGTGSLNFTKNEIAVTELTAGSGFFTPHLFDYYSNLSLSPALYFALPVVRKPSPNWYTCLGGGYIASGEPGWDRVPVVAWPEDAKLSPFEGCGEVQTPICTQTQLQINDPVLFRHAKAGELCERFNEIHLLDTTRGDSSGGRAASESISSAGATIKTVPTYRGQGQCFL